MILIDENIKNMISEYLHKYIFCDVNDSLFYKIKNELSIILDTYYPNLKNEIKVGFNKSTNSLDISFNLYNPILEESIEEVKPKKIITKQKSQIDDWKETMTENEVEWCLNKISSKIQSNEGYYNIDGIRAARAWKRTQIKRFKRLRTCCGVCEW